MDLRKSGETAVAKNISSAAHLSADQMKDLTVRFENQNTKNSNYIAARTKPYEQAVGTYSKFMNSHSANIDVSVLQDNSDKIVRFRERMQTNARHVPQSTRTDSLLTVQRHAYMPMGTAQIADHKSQSSSMGKSNQKHN